MKTFISFAFATSTLVCTGFIATTARAQDKASEAPAQDQPEAAPVAAPPGGAAEPAPVEAGVDPTSVDEKPAVDVKPASADPASPPEALKEPVLVLPITAQDADQPDAVVLSRLFLEELGRFDGIEVISGMELERLVSLEAEKEARGCLDESCMAEIAGALGADYVVSSQFSRLGAQPILTVQLFRASQARVIKRASRRANDVSAMADVLRSLAVEVMFAEFSPHAKKTAADDDKTPDATELPEVTGDADTGGASIVPWAVAGTGVAVLVIGAALGVVSGLYAFRVLGAQGVMDGHIANDPFADFEPEALDVIAEDRATLDTVTDEWASVGVYLGVASALAVATGSVLAGGGLGWGLLE